MAYRATFNPPSREVREALHDFEHLGIVSQLRKNPVRDSHGRCSNFGQAPIRSLLIERFCLKPLEETLKD